MMDIFEMELVEGIGNEVFLSFITGIIVLVILSWKTVRRIQEREGQEEGDGEVGESAMNRRAFNMSICPICWNQQAFALETNCGHLYCGQCLMTYHERNAHALSGVNCPMCRQKVNLLIICFTAAERDSQNPVLNEITAFARQYNRIMSQDYTFFDYITEIPVLLRRFIIQLFRGDNFGANYIRLRMIFFIFSTLLYVLMPYDIIPELVYGLYGFIEDILALAILLFYITYFYRHFLSQE